jgi:hypothetical protein
MNCRIFASVGQGFPVTAACQLAARALFYSVAYPDLPNLTGSYLAFFRLILAVSAGRWAGFCAGF